MDAASQSSFVWWNCCGDGTCPVQMLKPKLRSCRIQ
ncbi:unnamed protein product [Musa acuminata subsp. malaccensis]|uniref:(wild Malaysian banana) hypothetical protein n=1 Tax=Musa acuminata subsp. malaccensis TaxID=214687 RepID=A0A804HVK3_MUSAM|nr:unnamed protein product [Musa acuminata subsp. malaccensis]